jgi:hypothetical protein
LPGELTTPAPSARRPISNETAPRA